MPESNENLRLRGETRYIANLERMQEMQISEEQQHVDARNEADGDITSSARERETEEPAIKRTEWNSRRGCDILRLLHLNGFLYLDVGEMSAQS